MPPQPHPPVAEGAWLRPRPARQSRDCRRGRVRRHASLLRRLARLKAAASPAQHIRSALSQGAAGGAAHRRLRRIPAGRRVRMRRGLPSPGSVGIPPVAGSAASRLPPSASPAVTASASCRRPSSPLRATMARGKGEGRTLRAITNQRTHFAHLRGAERAPQKRTSADSAQGARRACHGARANPAPRGARRRRDGCDWRREASRPSQARRSGGWIAPRG